MATALAAQTDVIGSVPEIGTFDDELYDGDVILWTPIEWCKATGSPPYFVTITYESAKTPKNFREIS